MTPQDFHIMKKPIVASLLVGVFILSLLWFIYYAADDLDDGNFLFSVMRDMRHDQILAETPDEE